jgi:hypothetical protein
MLREEGCIGGVGMADIIVTTQKEWDEAPGEFDGYVVIKQGRICVAEGKGWGVIATGNATVRASGNATVRASGNATVKAWGNATVRASENATVEAGGNATVVAGGTATVEAWGNATVVAGGNATVAGQGNVQVVHRSRGAKIGVRGNARIVGIPDNPNDYCDFYGVTVEDGKAILYKAVRDNLHSFHNCDFAYAVGETKTHDCDPSRGVMCGRGMHVAHRDWALRFGESMGDFRVLEVSVPLDKIVVPFDVDGKVRCSELTVLREVPLEECGIYGKILANRRAAMAQKG